MNFENTYLIRHIGLKWIPFEELYIQFVKTAEESNTYKFLHPPNIYVTEEITCMLTSKSNVLIHISQNQLLHFIIFHMYHT